MKMDSFLQNRASFINNAIEIAKNTYEAVNDVFEAVQETFEIAFDSLFEPSEANEAPTQGLEVRNLVIERDDINASTILNLAKDIEETVQRLQGLNAAEDAENADLKHQLEKAKLKIGAQEMDLNARRLRIKEMTAREKKEDSNTKKLQLLHTQLEIQIRQMTAHEEKKDKKIKELEDLVANLHQQVNGEQASSKTLKKELKESKRRNDRLNTFINQQRQLFDEEMEHREKMEDKIAKLEDVIKDREDSMLEQEKDIKGLEDKIRYNGRAMTIVEQTNEHLVAAANSLLHRVEDNERTIHSFEGLREEMDETRASHLDLLVKNGLLSDQLDESKHYIENLKTRIDSIERVAEARNTSYEQVLIEKVQLCKKVNDSKDHIDHLEARLAFLEDSAELNVIDKSNLLNENRRLSDVIDDSKHHIDQLPASFDKPANSNIGTDNDATTKDTKNSDISGSLLIEGSDVDEKDNNIDDIPEGTKEPETSSEPLVGDTDVDEEDWEEIDNNDIEKCDQDNI